MLKIFTLYIVNYKNRIFVDELEFGAKEYAVKKASKRTLDLYAMYPEISTNDIQAKITIENGSCINLKTKTIHLSRFKNTNYLYGQLVIEGAEDGGRTRLTAEYEEQFASIIISVNNKV